MDEVKAAYRDFYNKLLGGEAMEIHNCDIKDDTSGEPVDKMCVCELGNTITNSKNGEAVGVDGIYKLEGDKRNCDNHRSTSLRSTIGTIYARTYRVMKTTEEKI